MMDVGFHLVLNKYVSPSYCRADMYADRVTCCPLVSHGEFVEDARPLHFAFC